MLVRDFDFELPADRIAQRPAPRGESRLFVLDAADPTDATRHRSISDLPELLRAGDLLVVNDTRVLAARLFAERAPGGGQIELLLAEKHADRTWSCLAKPGKRARVGGRLRFGGDRAPALEATIVAKSEDGIVRVEFDSPVEPLLPALGHVPLPPYIDRPDDASDRDAYQTVFAAKPGAIAAPTAGLHFSEALLARLARAGVERAAVTLHVGIGTFKPVVTELVHEHRMEPERYEIAEETARAIAATRAAGGRIVAVGTTVVRTLESASRDDGTVATGAGSTSLFVTPGYSFRVVDLLLTNFHLPCSTLLMLVAAFAERERVLAAYREAIARGYRFYSYGDAMLCARREAPA